MKDHTSITIKAQKMTVTFCEGVEIEAYVMPSGEYRYNLSGASQLVGKSENWLRRLLKPQLDGTALEPNHSKALSAVDALSGTVLESLLALGFSCDLQQVHVQRPQKGWAKPWTVSLDDLDCIIEYGVRQGWKEAIALSSASRKEVIRDRSDAAAGKKQMTIEDKQAVFAGYYYEDETEEYILPGDDNPTWNNATNIIVDYDRRGRAVYA